MPSQRYPIQMKPALVAGWAMAFLEHRKPFLTLEQSTRTKELPLLDRSIDVRFPHLRRRLETDPRDRWIIRTVCGVDLLSGKSRDRACALHAAGPASSPSRPDSRKRHDP